jgi:hypothetical protein
MAKFPILTHFAYGHSPIPLNLIAAKFHTLAHDLASDLAPGPELSMALRKLLEAKDAAIRAAIDSGWLEGAARAAAPTGPLDPISGQPLPAGSPYSMAHTPVRSAGEALRDIPHRNTVPTGFPCVGDEPAE